MRVMCWLGGLYQGWGNGQAVVALVPQSQHSASGAPAGNTPVWNSRSDEKPRIAKESGSLA